MSKKFKKQRKRKTFPWSILILGGILLIAVGVLYSNRTGGDGGDKGGGTPSIAVDPEAIDYGYVKFGGTRSFRIKVTNDGDGTLRFQEKPYVEVLEGC